MRTKNVIIKTRAPSLGASVHKTLSKTISFTDVDAKQTNIYLLELVVLPHAIDRGGGLVVAGGVGRGACHGARRRTTRAVGVAHGAAATAAAVAAAAAATRGRKVAVAVVVAAEAAATTAAGRATTSTSAPAAPTAAAAALLGNFVKRLFFFFVQADADVGSVPKPNEGNAEGGTKRAKSNEKRREKRRSDDDNNGSKKKVCKNTQHSNSKFQSRRPHGCFEKGHGDPRHETRGMPIFFSQLCRVKRLLFFVFSV